MATTELKSRGINPNRLSDKQLRFVDEYCLDLNATRAAVAAGYLANNAQVQGAKLMKHPLVSAAIGKRLKEAHDKYKISRETVVEQLYFCLTRDLSDFVDENTGKLLPLNKLPRRACAAVDGIKQKVRTWTDHEGEQHQEIETELKLVSKGQAIDMAMKHKALYAQEEAGKKIDPVDWDKLYGRDTSPNNVVDVQAVTVSETPLIEDQRGTPLR